jgi:hypothetical protein
VGFTEHRDSTIRSEAELLGAIDLPVLALTPFVTTEADLLQQQRWRRIVSVGVVGVLAGTGVLFWVLQLWKFVV